DEPGIRRVKRGRGFSYVAANGSTVGPAERTRIQALAIPPAWTDVWIATDPCAHLQATGRDAKGRKQYRYHANWRTLRDRDKFNRLADFGAGLDTLRPAVDTLLERGGLPQPKV